MFDFKVIQAYSHQIKLEIKNVKHIVRVPEFIQLHLYILQIAWCSQSWNSPFLKNVFLLESNKIIQVQM